MSVIWLQSHNTPNIKIATIAGHKFISGKTDCDASVTQCIREVLSIYLSNYCFIDCECIVPNVAVEIWSAIRPWNGHSTDIPCMCWPFLYVFVAKPDGNLYLDHYIFDQMHTFDGPTTEYRLVTRRLLGSFVCLLVCVSSTYFFCCCIVSFIIHSSVCLHTVFSVVVSLPFSIKMSSVFLCISELTNRKVRSSLRQMLHLFNEFNVLTKL